MPFRVRPVRERRKKLRQFQLNYIFFFFFALSLLHLCLCCGILESKIVIRTTTKNIKKRAKSKLFNFNTPTSFFFCGFDLNLLARETPQQNSKAIFLLLFQHWLVGTVNIHERLVEFFKKLSAHSHTAAATSSRRKVVLKTGFPASFAVPNEIDDSTCLSSCSRCCC